MSKTFSRATVTTSGLERTINAAVQQSDPDCEPFMGVYLEPSSNGAAGTNWNIKGIKYGRAPRSKCDAALNEIVTTLQERYLIEPTGSIPSAKRISSLNDGARQGILGVSPLTAAFKRLTKRR